MCGPFKGVLTTIREELIGAIYSGYYASDSGTLSFDQIPYFTAVERLEADKVSMLHEREVFRQALLKQRVRKLRTL